MTRYAANPSAPTQSSRVDEQTCRAISREVAKLAKNVTGKGPFYVRTSCREDIVVMLFEGVLTPLEKVLADSGANQDVKKARRALYESSRERLISVVEEQSGCAVDVALYDISPQEDVSGVIFVLEPEAG